MKHTYQVISQLQLLETQVVDMETGRRGFRSTNEKQFLEPYYSGLEKINPIENDLKELIEDEPEQQQRATRLEKEVDNLIAFWKSLGDDASDYTRDKIVTINSAEKEKMDRIRSMIGEMKAKETSLLLAREKENLASVRMAKYELAGGILLILGIVILLIFQVLKGFKKRVAAEARLKKNYGKLIVLNHENEERNFLLAALAKVNDVLRDHQLKAEALSRNVLDTVVDCLDFKAGAFYTYDEDHKKLRLTASFALAGTAKKEYALHEGFVGQAALQKDPLIVSDLPPNYASIYGGTLYIEPAHAIYASLYHDDQLKGMIEMLSFEPIREPTVQLLKAVTNNISVALHSAQSREKVLQLLEQVQQQKKTLEDQQEELRQTNEELTTQAEVLQASEEELRVQEEELRQINAELEEKNEAVVATQQALVLKAKELEIASKYKSEFLANMSHELRTPLNSVLILAKLLEDNKDHNLTEKQVAHAKIIHKSGSDLLDLINDILDLSKIEAGKVNLTIEDVSLKNIATDIEQLFAAVAEEKNIDYTVMLHPHVPGIIKTDRQKAEQVLKNLLSNAFKFTPQGGRIQLAFDTVTENGTSYIAISVKDSGIGIPKEKQQLIFEAFQQADGATNRKFGGTGLGLSITKELIGMLKGKIVVESEEDKGSTFTVLIPAHIASPDATAETKRYDDNISQKITEQSLIPDDRDTLDKEDKIMLIIEDDPVFASVIKDFANSKEFKTVVALSGDEGLYCAIKYRPSAIILDIRLPGIDGLTLLKMFKKDQHLKNIPVHVISALDNENSLSSGAIAFLKKPVEKDDFEKAFTLISSQLRSSVKRVLIFSVNNLKDELTPVIAKEKKDVIFDSANTITEALKKLNELKYDCIVADMDNNIEQGIGELNALNDGLLLRQVPVIIYLRCDITPADEVRLKKIANVIVRKSSVSNSRLLDEIELFVHKVDESYGVPEHAAIAASGNDKTLQNKKVLIVDDDMRNVFALSAALEQEKMEVTTANDGREALDILKKNKMDIVLMDIMMPHMDGYKAITYIRNSLHLKRLPIIALTAKAMSGDKEKCIEAGASDYISKPLDAQKLIALMRVWLS